VYRSAAVCERGHVITGGIYPGDDIATYCPKCGSRVYVACASCGERIRGRPEGVSGGKYTPPDFCDRCGVPQPWLSREGRIYLLENRLNADGLDGAIRLRLQEQLSYLRNPDLTEEEELKAWERIRDLAPRAWEKSGVQQIVTSLITAWGKQQMGLP
jgi:hypothetical protein